jgi:hypothetical protein
MFVPDGVALASPRTVILSLRENTQKFALKLD